jgi:hypothetical protein
VNASPSLPRGRARSDGRLTVGCYYKLSQTVRTHCGHNCGSSANAPSATITKSSNATAPKAAKKKSCSSLVFLLTTIHRMISSVNGVEPMSISDIFLPSCSIERGSLLPSGRLATRGVASCLTIRPFLRSVLSEGSAWNR